MKRLNQFITEKFRLSKDCIDRYTPETKNELKELIKRLIEERGNDADLNDIDTSEITDMSYLFNYKELINFDGDISEWDVSNVTNMYLMFSASKYSGKNGDISNWDVRNVENMICMFVFSKFNGDISGWDVSNVKNMDSMFDNCPLENNPPKWYKE